MTAIIYISLAFLLFFCVSAVMSPSLLKSAIFLAFASATLGVVMYVLGADWAAVIEVSACSGLVTVIFISAISLSKMKKDDVHKLYIDKKRMAPLPFILIGVGILLVAAAFAFHFTLTGAGPDAAAADNFREIFWNSRQADIIGQIITILVGGIAVCVLIRDDDTTR